METKKSNLPKSLVLDNNDQQVLYSHAHKLICDTNVTKEEAWFQASLMILNKKGLKVVDEIHIKELWVKEIAYWEEQSEPSAFIDWLERLRDQILQALKV